MEWLTGLIRALDYIEENLEGEVDLKYAAQLAFCSFYHFTRMLGYISGIPLAEYIRRRRLSIAAVELTRSGIKAVDLAQRFGCDSPTAFNRAFKALHGRTFLGGCSPVISTHQLPVIYQRRCSNEVQN